MTVAAPPLDSVTDHAEALLRSGRSREARDRLMAALPQIERRNDRAALRQTVNLLGAANFELGELTTATEFFHRALELGQLDGDDLLVARATNNLGAIANVRGNREQALTMYALAIAAYQRLGEARGLAAAHHNRGITFRQIGQLERADESECRAIDFAHEAGNARLLLLARIGRAEVVFCGVTRSSPLRLRRGLRATSATAAIRFNRRTRSAWSAPRDLRWATSMVPSRPLPTDCISRSHTVPRSCRRRSSGRVRSYAYHGAMIALPATMPSEPWRSSRT